MKWGILPPKSDGWYWLRVNARDTHSIIVQVEKGYVLGQIKIPLQSLPFQWYGPLKVPK